MQQSQQSQQAQLDFENSSGLLVALSWTDNRDIVQSTLARISASIIGNQSQSSAVAEELMRRQPTVRACLNNKDWNMFKKLVVSVWHSVKATANRNPVEASAQVNMSLNQTVLSSAQPQAASYGQTPGQRDAQVFGQNKILDQSLQSLRSPQDYSISFDWKDDQPSMADSMIQPQASQVADLDDQLDFCPPEQEESKHKRRDDSPGDVEITDMINKLNLNPEAQQFNNSSASKYSNPPVKGRGSGHGRGQDQFDMSLADMGFAELDQSAQIHAVQAAKANMSQKKGRGGGQRDQGRGRGGLDYSISSESSSFYEERKGQYGLSDLARRRLADRAPLQNAQEEVSFMRELAGMSRQEAMRQKEAILNDMTIEMPLTFDTKEFYLQKLEEFLEKESENERLNLETIAEANVAYEFEERLQIYCKMRLRVPKTHQQHLREHTILRVVIPVLNDPDTLHPTSQTSSIQITPEELAAEKAKAKAESDAKLSYKGKPSTFFIMDRVSGDQRDRSENCCVPTTEQSAFIFTYYPSESMPDRMITKLQQLHAESAQAEENKTGYSTIDQTDTQMDTQTLQKEFYIGTGTVKKVLVRAGDPLLTLIFQLDIVNPQSKEANQEIPSEKIQYGPTLDLRILYDTVMVEAHKNTVRKNLQKEKERVIWTKIPYKVQSMNRQKVNLELEMDKNNKSRGLRFGVVVSVHHQDNHDEEIVNLQEEFYGQYIGLITRAVPKYGKLTVNIAIQNLVPLTRHVYQQIPDRADFEREGQLVLQLIPDKLSKGQIMLRQCLLTSEKIENLFTDAELKMTLQGNGMPEFNKSQRNAIIDACKQRVTLIQGPPGTGKTRVLAAVVANMILQNPEEQTLVVTTMNFTADLVAEELYKLEIMKPKVLRTYSTSREDLFNIKIKELPEYSTLYKMLFESDDILNEYTQEKTTVMADLVSQMDQGDVLQAAKFQVEYYFGQTNYQQDLHLKELEDTDGWIELSFINNFRKMRKFGLHEQEVYTILELSTIVEVKETNNRFDELCYYVRRKKQEMNQDVKQLIGFDIEQIKQLTKEQFKRFMELKEEFEKRVIQKFPCIVTTVGTAGSRAMADRRFKRVIMDEATMIKEHEAFLATQHAEQIVLVGDQKQLGPNLGFKVNGPTSMFSRLIDAGYPHSFLDTQYRMHEKLMQVPNMLFYDNQIQCGYVGDIQKVFLYSKSPFLFVDVRDGMEKLKGTSFVNLQEVEAVNDMADLCINQFDEVQQIHKEVNGVPEVRFTKKDIFVITPYNAQKNVIVDRFLTKGMDEQVISIDSSQGREFDIVFVTMVRTKPGNFIQEYNRINVAITRAKHGLVIIGNAANLARDQKWASLLHEHKDNVVDGIQGAEQWISQQKTQYLRSVIGQ